MLVGISGVVCTLIGADIAHNLLIGEIQTWRSMWILTLIANVYALPSLIRLRREDDKATLAIVAFSTAIGLHFLAFFVPPVFFAAAPMMVLGFFVLLSQRSGWKPQFVGGGVCLFAMAVMCAAAILFIYAFTALGLQRIFSDALMPRPGLYSLVVVTLALLVLQAALTRADRRHRIFAYLAPAVAALLSFCAMYGWDARSAWTKFAESSGPVPQSLAEFLPANGPVYWEGGVELLWLRLERPNYYSCTQGTGAMFHRGTAMEFQHRTESFWALRTSDFQGLLLCPNLDEVDKPSRTREDLAEVCRREPKLDYLVLTRAVDGIEPKIWNSPVPFRYLTVVAKAPKVLETGRFFGYSCSRLRG
jgi:hypothetical protein